MDNWGLAIFVSGPYIVISTFIVLFVCKLTFVSRLIKNQFIKIFVVSMALFIVAGLIAILLDWKSIHKNENYIIWTLKLIGIWSGIAFSMVFVSEVIYALVSLSRKIEITLLLVLLVCSLPLLPFLSISLVIMAFFMLPIAYLRLRSNNETTLLFKLTISYLVMYFYIVVFAVYNTLMGYMAQA